MGKIIIVLCAAFLFGGCASKKMDADSAVKKNMEGTTKSATKESSKSAMAQGVETVKCSLEKDMRSLKVKPEGKGCELLYTKFAETKAVASSAWGVGHCKKSRTKLQTKLEEAGFKCE